MTMPSKKVAKPKKKTALTLLQERVEVLEKRPDIYNLDPEMTYLVVVPDSTIPQDFDLLEKAIRKYQNVVLISADKLSVVRIT